MHWISPSNAGTYDNLLAHLSNDGGIDDLMTGIASMSPPRVNRLVILRKH
jgi:hypothetical protein